jgi:hypothetical protein
MTCDHKFSHPSSKSQNTEQKRNPKTLPNSVIINDSTRESNIKMPRDEWNEKSDQAASHPSVLTTDCDLYTASFEIDNEL